MRFLLIKLIIGVFLINSLCALPVQAQNIVLPKPGEILTLSKPYHPIIMRGVKIYKNNPFLFDFLIEVGESNPSQEDLKKEGDKLIKYFLASLAIPDRDIWVNLSPYERNRIIPETLNQTDLGRDLLTQDYILKHFTSSLIYPENTLGKKFWNKVYAKTRDKFETTDIPINTLNKVWITADKAEVLEKDQTAFVINQHLSVLLEEDYNALNKNNLGKSKSSINSKIIKEIILPELEDEVNKGKNFANLRQIFNSVILASWYKKKLQGSIINEVYVNKNNVRGIHLNDVTISQRIYNEYLNLYKKGVFNYIKIDSNGPNNTNIERKYFSGGLSIGEASSNRITITKDFAMNAYKLRTLRDKGVILRTIIAPPTLLEENPPQTSYLSRFVSKPLIKALLMLSLSIPTSVFADTIFSSNIRVDDDTESELNIQKHPSIAIGPSGTIYTTWDDERNSTNTRTQQLPLGNNIDIYFASSTDGGKTFSANVMVNDHRAKYPRYNKHSFLAVDKDENIYVLYDDGRDRNYDLYLAKSTDRGKTFKPAVKVNTSPGNSYREYSSMAFGTNGEIYVVWWDNNVTFGPRHLYFARSANGGESFESSIVINAAGLSDKEYGYPDIKVAPNGKIFIAVEENSRDYKKHNLVILGSPDGGQTFSRINQIYTEDMANNFLSMPVININANNEILLTWGERRANGFKIFFSKSVNEGLNFTTPKIINDDPNEEADHYRPISVLDAKGKLYVVWEGNSRGYFDIYYKESIDGGETFSKTTRIDDAGNSPTGRFYPAFAVDAKGNVNAIWDDNRKGGQDWDIYFSKGFPSPENPLSYKKWLAQYFSSDQLDNPNIIAEEVDLDNDGIPNIYEYAFGFNPLDGTSKSPYKNSLVDGNFVLEYRISREAAEHLEFQILTKSAMEDQWEIDPKVLISKRPIDEKTVNLQIKDSLRTSGRFYKLVVVPKITQSSFNLNSSEGIVTTREASKINDAIGGIDLNTSSGRMEWMINTANNVEINTSPAFLNQMKQQFIYGLTPNIIKILPMDLKEGGNS